MSDNAVLEPLEAELLARAAAAFSAMAEGLDVSPATLYRFQGLAEAWLLMGGEAQALWQRLAELAETQLGDGAAAAYRDAAAEAAIDGASPSLFLHMREAPVYAPGQAPS